MNALKNKKKTKNLIITLSATYILLILLLLVEGHQSSLVK
jgi:hypothetical protein